MREVSIEEFRDDIVGVDQFPVPYIQTNSVLKLLESDDRLIIGAKGDPNKSVLKQMELLYPEIDIEYVSLNAGELASYLSRLSSKRGFEDITAESENDLNKLASDAPVINLVNAIIIDGINMGASDIHIEGYKDKVILRYRVDGVLLDGEPVSIGRFTSLSSRIKIMANLNIMERRKPQDGRVSVTLDGSNVDLRISIIPLSEGESIVLRLFIKKSELLTLEVLGYRGRNLEILEDAAKLSHGLILVTGPTGSGKTTTLNALLQRINSREKKIITIEDPVEYSVPDINQIQVNHDIDLGFHAVLKRVLRQDPDIIMIGEIRDRETAELVIRAALTGHLVLSTLHTNDAASSISRLKDMGVADYLITSVLKVSLAQRLLRTLCSECGGSGCKKCNRSGFRGRIAVSEGFKMDEKLETLILDSAKPYKIRRYLKNSGMISMEESALQMVSLGVTSKSEISRILSC